MVKLGAVVGLVGMKGSGVAGCVCKGCATGQNFCKSLI
jgi:hypothetical protein